MMNDDKEKKMDDLVADPISQSSDSLSLKPALMAEFGSWSSSASVESVTSGWCNNNNNNPYLYASISNPEEGSEEGHEHSTVGHSHQCEHLASKAPVILPHIAVISFKERGGGSKDGEEAASTTSYTIVSSHPQPFSPSYKKGVCDGLSKTHNDFEVPPYFAEVLAQMNFQLGEAIGSGTFGKVYRATYTDETPVENGKSTTTTTWKKKNQTYAVKVMDTGRLSEKYKKFFLLRELWALRSLPSHPNICRMYHLFTINEVEKCSSNVPNNKIITMIMEHCTNGDVFEFAKKRDRLPECLARRWFAQLLAAVDHLHQHGIAHRDLKCENLLLDDDFNLKLCDFGFCIDLTVCEQCETTAKAASDRQLLLPQASSSTSAEEGSSSAAAAGRTVGLEKRSLTFCGSTNYCSPELLQAEPYSVALNDVWACGVILYVWLFKAFPISPEQLDEMETFQFSMITFGQEEEQKEEEEEENKEPQLSSKQQEQQLREPLSADCLHVLKSIFQPEESRSSVARLLTLPWVANCPKSTPITTTID